MVEYKVKQMEKSNCSMLNTILKESNEYFANKERTSILGEGIKDIFTDDALFDKYVENLCEGVESESDRETLKTLMDNARFNTLSESSTSGIAPVASLTLPILRVMWARTGLVKAVPTEPVKSNSFSVSYNRPCIVDENGEKHYLPEALDNDPTLGDKKHLQEDAMTLPLDNYDLLGAVGCSKATGDSVDRNFRISAVEMNGKEITVTKDMGKTDLDGKLYVEVEDKDTGDKDIIFGNVDFYNGILTALSFHNKVTKIYIAGYVASDAHNHATNITFDMVRKDFLIGTGDHFEAALPIEFLQDTMATYSVDGTTECVDIISNIIAQKLDMEIFNFLVDCYNETDAHYFGEFDIRPASQFAGQPKDWREELKTVFDHVASTMKTETHVYNGYFVIFGNPVDMMLLPNVNWTFNSATDMQSGVEVNYSLGAMSGQNRYTMVSSDLIPKEAMYMLFIPTIPNYKSVVYYPYTFNMVNPGSGYLNTRTPNVPSLMMTKRHTYWSFNNLIARINILNNTARMLSSLPR